MADYTLAAHGTVIRNSDKATIPNDPANRDRVQYDKWLAQGNTPDPYVAPPPPGPAPQTTVLYDHENRLRSQEGQPPLSLDEFLTKSKLG